MVKAAILYTVITEENKLLGAEAVKKGFEFDKINENELILDVANFKKDYDVILSRSSSFMRGLYAAKYYEDCGTRVINSYDSQALCGDKYLTSRALAKAKVPTPKTLMAFTPDAVHKAVDTLGYPVVMKPTIGSWARLLAKINDYEALQGVVEHREVIGNYFHKLYYLQEHVNKPGRDIRAFVVGDEVICAIYRVAKKGEWITNTSRGGSAENCPVTPELREMCLKSVKAVGGNGVYGVDLMETTSGLTVHEINHTTEFRNSIKPTGVNIPAKIVEFVYKMAKK
ncbi:Glutamate--LysW ligase ArgX [Candidatus Gugararchaeum adminiculabundum]|nr:Glutamate--LysW ligase ArgX [Candidatus Gugararchaeum adminiculabundum]